MQLMTKLETAEFLRFKGTDKQKTLKINNWLEIGILPRSTTTKLGRSVLFIQEKLEEFLLSKGVTE